MKTIIYRRKFCDNFVLCKNKVIMQIRTIKLA